MGGSAFTFRFTVLPGDANQDGHVNQADRDVVNGHTSGGWTSGDMNGDGSVNSSDLTIVNSSANFGKIFYAYLQADYNLDGAVDNSDIQGCIDAIISPTAYKQLFYQTTEDRIDLCDLTNDGLVNNDDLDRLFDLLT